MFCRTTYYALLMIMEVALVYGTGKKIDLAFISHNHAIPLDAFDGVLGVLRDKHFIVVIGDGLQLQRAPEKISIWQIVTEVAENSIFRERYYDNSRPVAPTSAMIMLHKEQAKVLKLIESRLIG